MARAHHVQNKFTAGEFSPRLHERYDFERYDSAVAVLENFLPTPQGPVVKRPGTRYAGAVKDPGAVLYAFRFSSDQAAVLEFGPLYIRFWANGGQVVDGSGNPVEVSTPYTATEIPQLHFAQEADTLFIFHENHPPKKLVRLSATDWQLRDHVLEPPPTGEEGHTPSANLTLSATTGTGVTVTADADAFEEVDVDRILQEDPSVGTGTGIVVDFTDRRNVTIDVISSFSSTSLTSGNWKLLGSPVAQLKPDKAGPIGAKIKLTLQRILEDAPELVTNGEFSSMSGWTDHSGPVVVTGTATGGYRHHPR